ncbi:hypothetical protein AALP_AA2G096200 [Arabis alpina]|uniref:Uncharacterized protein n=1 Tax=Arabis alpina TaxID=50452 RepID=A0A087HGC8_ARAAL|nr:hypothetical protein AALP_AA2G096200 [Arabis alpina]
MEDRADEDEDEEEEIEGDDEEVEHVEGLEDVVDDEAARQDIQELLDNILAIPGRENLPPVSEVPIPCGKKSLCFSLYIIYLHFTSMFDHVYDKEKLTCVMAEIFCHKFDGAFFRWTETPIDKQERYFRTFVVIVYFNVWRMYNWDIGITELVRAHFNTIATKRMRGIVSQAKKMGVKRDCTMTSNCCNSNQMEELGRPVSWGEEVAETYEIALQEVMDQDGDAPDNSDDYENSTQRNLAVAQKNEIFLKFDPKGSPYEMGQLTHQLEKGIGKRKINNAESSTSSLLEIHYELKSARYKIAQQDKDYKRRDAENLSLSTELKSSESRIAILKKMVTLFTKISQLSPLVLLYVATKMTSIRRASFLVASPEGYAKACLRFVGYETRCTPYWPHALMGAVVSILPESVFESFNIKRCLQIRKKGLLKESRKNE